MASVIVVEGVHDQMRILEAYPEAQVILTNGSEISKETLELIQQVSLTNEIIIFTDPDTPGEKIRQRISEVVPEAKHAFLRKRDAISKNHKKVGIEHASIECIQDSLSHIYEDKKLPPTITIKDLYALHLLGMPMSRRLRDEISLQYNIGKPNGKTFLKRLNMLQITKEELYELCQKLEV